MSQFKALLIFIIAVGFFHSADGYASQEVESASCAHKYCSARWVPPLVRVLVVDAAMYGGLVAIWPESFVPSAGSAYQFNRSFSDAPEYNPQNGMFRSDGDPVYINGPLHSLYGSEAYLAARDWGYKPAVSFGVTVLASFTWEYFIEGWFHQPSAIDLVWTSFAGAVLGELRYQLLSLAYRRIRKPIPRAIVMTLLDPLGQLERAVLKCTIF